MAESGGGGLKAPPTPGRPGRLLVALAVFMSGGAVMVVELLGVRLISPVFGTGLHVWAALISVALAALALGYFLGGRLADRRPSPGLFFGLIVAAAAGVLAIPLYAPVLIPAFEPVGLRTGALLAAAVTFFPPLLVLGAVTPFSVRISTAAVADVGKTAGRLYAISTLGSVAGTLAAGFLLTPLLSIDATLRIVGLALAAVGAAGLLAGGRRAFGAVLLCLAGASFAIPAPAGPAPDGRLVFRGDTPFQRVEVVEVKGERRLILNGCIHTRASVDGPVESVWSYIRMFSYLPGYRSEASSLLVLGLGGGSIMPLLEGEVYRVTVVELDPVVVDVAREHFGTLEDVEEIHVADARAFVRRAERTWDLVALDVCDADRMPEHLVTREFFAELKGVLAPGGVLAMNSLGPNDGRTLASINKTLEAEFRHVDALATVPEGPLTNVIFFASDEPLELSWPFDEEAAPNRIELQGGRILTDQLNPINHWNAPWAREIRMRRAERY